MAPLCYEGVTIDYCEECRGVWLDYGELSRVVETKQRKWGAQTIQAVLTKLSSYNQPPLGEDRELACPVCEELLEEVHYQGTSNIVVNPCAQLHGVWLDRGELVYIQIYMEHWAQASIDNADRITGSLQGIRYKYEAMREQLIAEGPSSKRLVNEALYEVLEYLDSLGKSEGQG